VKALVMRGKEGGGLFVSMELKKEELVGHRKRPPTASAAGPIRCFSSID
jgi:hypothetical protein